MALFLASLCQSSNLYCGENAEDIPTWGVDATAGEPVDESEVSLFSISGEMPHSLLAAEDDYMPCKEYITRTMSYSVDLTARQDAINWILKVSEFYRFRPVTTYLSVNYLDRFLSANTLSSKTAQWQMLQKQNVGVWPIQLLSVACLSAAAKMEETQVPLLLDLQILNPKFVFEPRTICRMELLLMTTLRWRMRAVTPFDFLTFFAAGIQTAAATSTVISPSFFSRFADLILSTHRVIDFLRFPPSITAAAAVLCAASEVTNSPATFDSSSVSSFHELVSMEKINKCRQLMEDFLMDACHRTTCEKATLPEDRPRSPIGILDAAACGSCDTQRSSAAAVKHSHDAGNADLPAAKRRRIPDSLCTGRKNSLGVEDQICGELN